MSNPNQARRTSYEVKFGGVDITSSLARYLLSLTYTDNEEDEADDLQIKLQDRDGIWVERWLNEAVDAAASDTVATGDATSTIAIGDVVNFTGNQHFVSSTGDRGYAARPGPGKVTQVNLNGKHPYHLIHADNTTNLYGWVNASDIQMGSNGTEDAASSAASAGLTIGAVITRQNWNGDGKDDVLNCGTFELDNIKAGGPQSAVTIKATSLPYNAQIRQTKKTRAWESYTLSGIAEELATANGMALMFLSTADPLYPRVEQSGESDIELLSRLCHDIGISLKATNNILVLFDQAEYESKPAVRTIRRGDGSYIKYDLSIGTANKKYQSCRVSYVSPTNGKGIEGIAYIEGYNPEAKTNQQLEVTAKVANVAEAKSLAEKRLRLYNKYQRMVTFTMPGDPSLVAGVTFEVADWGALNGKYIIKTAVHSISGSGYTTKITGRRVLEGY